MPKINQVVLDIGAQCGDYTLWLAKNGNIVNAFEPLEKNVRILMENLKMNAVSKDSVRVFPIAVSRKKGKISLSYDANSTSPVAKIWRNGG